MDTRIRQLLAEEKSVLFNLKTLDLDGPAQSPVDANSISPSETRIKRPTLTSLVTADLPVYRQ